MLDELRRLMGPMTSSLKGMVGRAIIKLIQESTKVRTLQCELMADEVGDDIEHFQDYGFTSRPKPECEAIIVFPGGARSHGVVIATEDRRYRLTSLEEGEVAIYDDQGQVVHLKRDGILVETDKPVTVNAGKLLVTTSAEVSIDAGGTVTVTADQVVVDSSDIQLGGSGAKVALVGDAVAGGFITGPGASHVRAS